MTGPTCPKGSDPNCRTPVYLNVYDLTPMNGYVYWVGLGIFHSGIEAHGAEYAFGAHDYPTSGVFEVEPKHCPGFTFRTSVSLGTTNLNPAEFRSFIEQCADEYYGDTYHLIVKNCNHFSEDVCQRLIGKGIPGWVNRLARVGYMCNCLLPEGLQVTAVDTPEFQHPSGENGRDFGGGKEMVESESDQERALITTPNGDTQALMRDSFKEVVFKPKRDDENRTRCAADCRSGELANGICIAPSRSGCHTLLAGCPNRRRNQVHGQSSYDLAMVWQL